MEKDMRFGTWKVRSLCRVGAIGSVVRELEKYTLDLVGWEGRDMKQQTTINFSMKEGMLITN
jgi:hypothetical protein